MSVVTAEPGSVPIPGARWARLCRTVLLAAHASAVLFLPFGSLLEAMMPSAGQAALYGGYLLPTVLALAAVVLARKAFHRGHPQPVAPTGHISTAVRNGTWTLVIVAMLLLLDANPTGFASLLLKEAALHGTWDDVQEALYGWIHGLPVPRGPSDTLFAWAGGLAVYGFAAVVTRGSWSFVRLCQHKPVRPAWLRWLRLAIRKPLSSRSRRRAP